MTAPAPLPPPPGAPPGYGQPPMVPKRSSGPGKVLLVLAVVVSLGLCGLVGGGAGWVTGTMTTNPEELTALPSVDADFPTGDRRYLPGVKVATVVEDWMKKANSYNCSPPDEPSRTISEASQRLECMAPGDLKWDLTVDIEFDDETHVRYVRADCEFKPGSKACTSLFATMADALLRDNAELRKQAYEWAEKNAETDNVTAIGGIRFKVSLEPRSIVAEPAL
ncbi:hypothetical protein [Micromonospora polyrhachis]|uniref:Uncharacterized protein n=1 Tax=Micromonospora polyrhachis TaxID=1282883 RepID=A0A7W7SQ95_9ACTN|nr:hypothetical protein [Micromonospora polyrhachis]MBB4958836.1 hypothetical protein [Micromonospora polyrhachis]